MPPPSSPVPACILVQGRGARDYRGRIAELAGVEIAFVSASEIVGACLPRGTAHMGVTGEDLLRESIADADTKVELLAPLGFGHANVVVAVPQAWIDVKTMADLEDVAVGLPRHAAATRMRVATKYVNLTRRFFAARHVTDYRIVESLGATEGAPAAGTAELIVDITTTGSDARRQCAENARRRRHSALGSQSRGLARSALGRRSARNGPRHPLAHRGGRSGAHHARGLGLSARSHARFLCQSGSRLHRPLRRHAADGFIVLSCPTGKVAALADWLIAQGAEDVTVAALDYVFSATESAF